MKNFFISVDVEPDLHSEKYHSLNSMPSLLSLLKKYNVLATFFVTCDCIKKNPVIFKEIKKQGHEIALHGYDHKRFEGRSYAEKKEDIKKSLDCFKKYLKIRPIGFRAPQHSIDKETVEILKDYQFRYDSSILPWNIYHLIFFWKIRLNFFHNFTSMNPYKINNFLEIPISSFFLPFSSLTLRIFSKSFLRIYLAFLSFYKSPVFFMHSWDFIEIPESKLYRICPKKKFMERFEYMLDYLSKRASSQVLEKRKIMQSSLG